MARVQVQDGDFKEALFYLLSGTGNTFRMAAWMAAVARERGIRVKQVMIEEADPTRELKPNGNCLLAVLYPTHGFMPPWSMIKFLLKMPRRPGVPAICGATRGALTPGPFKIPGAAGWATFLAALVLWCKGYRVRAMFSLDMPSNMTSLHWGLHPRNIDRIKATARVRARRFMARVLDGRRLWFTLNNLWDLAWTVGILWLVPVWPVMYLVIARLFMAKVMFSNNSCVGCGLCARFCANQAIAMKKIAGKKRPYWTHHCENCLRCMGYCRKKAVEAGHSWALMLYYLISVPMISYGLAWLRRQWTVIPIVDPTGPGYWLSAMINLLYMLPALFLAYYFFWLLVRIPIVNTFFSVTTLTRYYRRYHEPETRLAHMSRKRRVRPGRDTDFSSAP